ncbi:MULTISPECIES: four helix bundle protein [Clostridium]|jgi:hypothetical protein|uniref:four helix bundle protein n=1 Tax=Clostridium TaxID=1485 RepID=UPI000E888133|nr:four helix bundle protein [Clostridium tyrobutyricum]HBF76913.1 hypothetical protein [Clostridiaceae bacterium]
MAKNNNYEELTIIKKAKDLSAYIFQITQHSPKKFRFSLITRLQNYSLDLIDCLNDANTTFIDIKLLRDLDKSIRAATYKLNNVVKTQSEACYFGNKILTLKLTKATKFDEEIKQRLNLQHKALSLLQKIDHLTLTSKEMYCINNKQQEMIAKYISDIRKLLYKWISSDKKRYKY